VIVCVFQTGSMYHSEEETRPSWHWVTSELHQCARRKLRRKPNPLRDGIPVSETFPRGRGVDQRSNDKNSQELRSGAPEIIAISLADGRQIAMI